MNSTEERKRVLILTADAGSGHRSAAIAIEAALQERYGAQCSSIVINPLRAASTPSFLQAVTEDNYNEMVRKDPALYELSYWLSDSLATAAIIDQVVAVMLHDTL
ncbi:MAG: MGDG synthase family glycosyltransferase, partial [Anaerolineae bacterium]